MSRMLGDNRKLREEIKSAVLSILSVWSGSITCAYDGTVYSKHDYVLQASHSWGTSQCNWTKEYEKEIRKAMVKLGACNIKCSVSWNHVYVSFDQRKDYEQFVAITQ